jgi:hypothetical protein
MPGRTIFRSVLAQSLTSIIAGLKPNDLSFGDPPDVASKSPFQPGGRLFAGGDKPA